VSEALSYRYTAPANAMVEPKGPIFLDQVVHVRCKMGYMRSA
jgi:hypothetical protein